MLVSLDFIHRKGILSLLIIFRYLPNAGVYIRSLATYTRVKAMGPVAHRLGRVIAIAVYLVLTVVCAPARSEQLGLISPQLPRGMKRAQVL